MNQNLVGIELPQTQMIATHFNLDRVPKRRIANEFDGGADEQAHFQEAAALVRCETNFSDSRDGSRPHGR